MAAVRKPVLLGLRDAAVKGCPKGPAAWTNSKLGGVPDALPAVTTPGPRCGRCAQPLTLVVQVYCPLEGSPFHRLLYVFACARPGCGDSQTRSWKVFRSQCLQVPEKETRNAQNQSDGLEAENWCEGSHDWGSDTEETPPLPPTSDLGSDSNDVRALDWTEKLQALHLQDPGLAVTCPSPSGEGLAVPTEVPQFQPYYICVAEEEDYGNFVDLDHAHSLLQEYQKREGVGMEQLLSLGSSDGDEKYEKTKVSSGDPTFYKFMKRIATCQEQILRYSWSGEPLFLSCPTFEVSEVPTCSGCGGQRTFEFQLMPALVSMLSSAGLGLTVEFGTILVYTCKQSCWPPDQQIPMEEFCVIQEDPDEFLFKLSMSCPSPHSFHHTCAIDSDCLSLLDQLVQLEQKVTEHMQSFRQHLEGWIVGAISIQLLILDAISAQLCHPESYLLRDAVQRLASRIISATATDSR